MSKHWILVPTTAHTDTSGFGTAADAVPASVATTKVKNFIVFLGMVVKFARCQYSCCSGSLVADVVVVDGSARKEKIFSRVVSD